jgi:TRAP-type C4-dicarboxylate transport system substrate-binding protein
VKHLALKLAALPIAVGLALAPSSAAARKVKIKLGTLAPEGTAWHNALLRIDQRWQEASGGKVRLKVYPGGVAGDEGDMVRKMRIGQLHAAMVTGIGLGRIHRATIALQVPMLIHSWEELDYIRERIGPKIEKDLESAGFVVLNWGDAGWVHFFSKKPAKTVDEFRRLKLMVWNGDPEAERIWRLSKFNPVPLSSTDVMNALQTGMVEAFGTTPLHALASQWFGLAKQMVRLNWSPLNGATVVSKKQWEKIPAELRPELMKIAREEGDGLKQEVRGLADKAIKAMVERGLKVVEPDQTLVEQWQKVAAAAYPEISGKVVPEAYFNEVQRLAEEFRAKKK